MSASPSPAMTFYARTRYACKRAFDGLHWALVRFARPLGVEVEDSLGRYARFAACYGVVYLVGCFADPVLAYLALAWGLLWVVAVSQAWAWNEHQRAQIARKVLPEKNADDLPNLRLFALVSAAQLVFLLPLLCLRLHHAYGLFAAGEHAHFLHWVGFVLDKALLKFLPDWTALQWIHVGAVGYSTPPAAAEKLLITLAWALFTYVLLAGAAREYQIRQNLADAVAAVLLDPDLAVRQGRRVVRRLLLRLQEPGVSAGERENILEALGRLRARGAAGPVRRLTQAHRPHEEGVRAAAIVCLGRLGVPETLGELEELLCSSPAAVRAAAATALGDYPEPGALPPLLSRLRAMRQGGLAEPDPNVRGQVVLAVGRAAASQGSAAQKREVLELILRPSPSLLEDAYLRVRSRATTALEMLADPEAVRPLAHMVETTPNPKLLGRAVPVLAGLASQEKATPQQRQRAVEALLRLQDRHRNDDVLIAVAEGLVRLKPAEAADALARLLGLGLKADRQTVAEAAGRALRALGPGPARRAKQIRHRHNKKRSHERLARLEDASLDEGARCRAAAEVTAGDGAAGEAALRRVYEGPGAPPRLRESALSALRRLNPALAKAIAPDQPQGG